MNKYMEVWKNELTIDLYPGPRTITWQCTQEHSQQHCKAEWDRYCRAGLWKAGWNRLPLLYLATALHIANINTIYMVPRPYNLIFKMSRMYSKIIQLVKNHEILKLWMGKDSVHPQGGNDKGLGVAWWRFWRCWSDVWQNDVKSPEMMFKKMYGSKTKKIVKN